MLKKIFFKIIFDENQSQKFNSLKNKTEMYNLFCENGYTKSFDEFEKEIDIFINSEDMQKLLNSDFDELSDEMLEMIAGGSADMKKRAAAITAGALTVLTVGGIFGSQFLNQNQKTPSDSSPSISYSAPGNSDFNDNNDNHGGGQTTNENNNEKNPNGPKAMKNRKGLDKISNMFRKGSPGGANYARRGPVGSNFGNFNDNRRGPGSPAGFNARPGGPNFGNFNDNRRGPDGPSNPNLGPAPHAGFDARPGGPDTPTDFGANPDGSGDAAPPAIIPNEQDVIIIRIKVLNNQIKQHTEKRDRYLSQLNHLKKSKASQYIIDTYKDIIKAENETITTLEIILDLESQKQSDNPTKSDSIEQHIVAATQKYHELVSKIAVLELQKNGLEGNQQTPLDKSQYDKQREEKEKLQKQLYIAKTELSKLEKQQREIENSIKRNNKTIDTLNATITTLDKEISSLKQEKIDIKKRIPQENYSSNKDLIYVYSKIKEKTNRKYKAQIFINDLIRNIRNLKLDLDDLKNVKIARSKSTIDILTQQLSNLNQNFPSI